jgi:hypothetical protein
MGPPKPIFRDVTTAEQKFADTIRNFIASYDPRLQPVVARIARGWVQEWSNMALPTLFPPAGNGLSDFMGELHHAIYHRQYYARNREHILQRQRRAYARRRHGGPTPPTDA